MENIAVENIADEIEKAKNDPNDNIFRVKAGEHKKVAGIDSSKVRVETGGTLEVSGLINDLMITLEPGSTLVAEKIKDCFVRVEAGAKLTVQLLLSSTISEDPTAEINIKEDKRNEAEAEN